MARDFFDELSDTITRTTKDLGKKAGQLYEAQKIRSKISSEEQMVQKLKADIGNVIFEKYKEGAEAVSYTHLDVYKRQALLSPHHYLLQQEAWRSHSQYRHQYSLPL